MLKSSKSFGSRPPIRSISCENCKGSIFNLIFGTCFPKKNLFWHLKNDLFTFITKNLNLTLAILFGMVSPMFVPNIITLYEKYDRDIAMNLVIWLESREPS